MKKTFLANFGPSQLISDREDVYRASRSTIWKRDTDRWVSL